MAGSRFRSDLFVVRHYCCLYPLLLISPLYLWSVALGHFTCLSLCVSVLQPSAPPPYRFFSWLCMMSLDIDCLY